MTKHKRENKIMVLGAYGTFGRIITNSLVQDEYLVIGLGRDKAKLSQLQQELNSKYLEILEHELKGENLLDILHKFKPKVVINTCGPYIKGDYQIITQCVKADINYIDLSDNRDYVCQAQAKLKYLIKNKRLSIIVGASTVPALSSAVVSAYRNKFSKLESLVYGISPGQKSPRGLATTKSILSYLGKRFGKKHNRFGWQGLYLAKFPNIGSRTMGFCDIPDLDLFPSYYNVKNIKFSAGMESKALHLCMWVCSWLVRLKIIRFTPGHARYLLKMSHWFDVFGSDNGGMHVKLSGLDKNLEKLTIKWFLEAYNGCGPQVPCVPSVFLAKNIVNQKFNKYGVMPCIDLISLEEYMHELKDFEVKLFMFE